MRLESKINDTWKRLNNKARTCMFEDCQDKAIKSHVLQKNGIIKQISENNHLIQLVPSNAFQIEKSGIHQFKSVGINNVYTFSGFCNKHDTEIFHPIESESKLDLYLPYHQALFSYRGLCQEIRRKEISIEWMGTLVSDLPNEVRNFSGPLTDGFTEGIKNLTFFKKELEKTFRLQKFDNFIFSTIEIPKLELCISVPLNTGETENPKNLPYEKWVKDRKIPFSTSFINIFPLKNKSFFIGGFHKDYPCEWTKKKIKKLGYAKNKVILKEISDLIVLRLEFWAMSPRLFKLIPDDTIRKYKQTFSENIFNHSGKMRTKINLFEKR